MPGALGVVYAAAEMVPFAKVGGLADVAGALTLELARRGHQVATFLPLYPSAREVVEALGPEEVTRLEIPIGARRHSATVLRVTLGESAVTAYFVRCDEFFDRPNPYVDPETKRDWPDNALRFTFFCRAILETCRALDCVPDVFHLNDYQLAPLALLLRGTYGRTDLAGSAIVYSIHNLGYQGIFPRQGEDRPAGLLARELGFGESLVRPLGPLEFYGRLNFTKAALTYADLIIAVSPTYAREIQTPELGFGLDGILRERDDRVLGILNGIDTQVWDPARDELIPHNYGISDFRGKAENKKRLLAAMHLPEEVRTPLIGIISRLVDQKGFDLIARIADELFGAADFRMVVLGSGMPKYETLMRELADRYPERIAVEMGFHDALAHLIEAGCDFFLMPSRYEPCGLNQMYSMRYGTVPIVRATGGLADTVEEFDPRTGRGSGFVFHAYEPGALLSAVRRALETYGRPRVFKKLVTKIMRRDFSWGRAAGEYEEAYRRAIREREGACRQVE
ncbi:MAG: glycogen synthase [Candidatus Eisenbacteria sp.]|nr:glycogen synthase [Candidatus Eisenbacteria bacterium]